MDTGTHLATLKSNNTIDRKYLLHSLPSQQPMSLSPAGEPGSAAVVSPPVPHAGLALDLGWGLGLWLATGIVILGSGWFGWRYLIPNIDSASNTIESYRNWDGNWYRSILEKGYNYREGIGSNVAFFPCYPLLSAAVQRCTGCEMTMAMLLVSQGSLAIGFVAFFSYLRRRFATLPAYAPAALVLFALFPPTFFYRICYSEALFFCLLSLTLLAVECRLPLVVPAFFAGMAASTRPVGVALALVILREIWVRSDNWKHFVFRCAWLLPLSIWGLIAYSGYLYDRFGEPLAFIKAQEHWNLHPAAPLSEKLYALVTLKPIWGSFVPGSGHCFGTNLDLVGYPMLASGANGIVYVFGLFLLGVGVWKRWLNTNELLVTLGLLGIPYLTRGFESHFLSFAPFTSVAIPIYIPLTMLFMRAPRFAQVTYMLISAWIIIMLSAVLGRIPFGIIEKADARLPENQVGGSLRTRTIRLYSLPVALSL